MQLIFKTQEAGEAEVLFYPLVVSQKAAKDLISGLNYEDKEAIISRIDKENFSGKKGEIFLIHDDRQTVVLLGTGQEKVFGPENWRQAAGEMVIYLKKYQVAKIGVDLKYWLKGKSQAELLGQSMAEGFSLANYEFAKYKKISPDKRNLSIEEFYIYCNSAQKKSWLKGWDFGCQLAEGVKLTRDLVNEPAGTMTPDFLAKEAVNLVKKSKNIKVKILEKEEIAKLGMNAFLAIARGSNEAPKFIHLVYKPQKGAKKKVALVGKGITFDSGGLNIKPWESMGQMKIDMGGAAMVLGIFSILDYLKPKVEVHGIIAACENMPSGGAVKPGDVITSMQGKTIEIGHTDAEGRVTLADSLTYAQKQGIDTIIDMATLTGAVIMALGPEYAALFTNHESLANNLLQAAKETDENIWPLPLADEYKDLNKSQVADIRNIPNIRMAGAITAAWFLAHFIEEGVNWAHIDIAGPVYAEKPVNSYTPAGGSGFGVRAIARWLRSL